MRSSLACVSAFPSAELPCHLTAIIIPPAHALANTQRIQPGTRHRAPAAREATCPSFALCPASAEAPCCSRRSQCAGSHISLCRFKPPFRQTTAAPPPSAALFAISGFTLARGVGLFYSSISIRAHPAPPPHQRQLSTSVLCDLEIPIHIHALHKPRLRRS